MMELKPCKCGNEYPTLRIVDCASGSKLYQVYCKDCKKSASVSTSREEAETYWNKDMARNDLKPCPFCGKTPYTMISGRENNVEIKIGCNKCHFGLNGYSKNELIAKWNRRTDNGKEDI